MFIHNVFPRWCFLPLWVCVCVLSHLVVFCLAIPWTVAHQDPLSMGFSSRNPGVGCHFLVQGIFSTQELSPHLFASTALAGRSFTASTTWEALSLYGIEF